MTRTTDPLCVCGLLKKEAHFTPSQDLLSLAIVKLDLRARLFTYILDRSRVLDECALFINERRRPPPHHPIRLISSLRGTARRRFKSVPPEV